MVPVNPGLVAIIGGRGSGKTALADLIAVGSGSSKPFDNPSSFLERAKPLLGSMQTTIHWGDEQSTQYNARTSDMSFEDGHVRYLSQQFVERLCASEGGTGELLDEVERVVFESLPIEDRQGALTFGELLIIRLAESKARQSEHIGAVESASEAIINYRSLQREAPHLKSEVARLATQSASLTRQVVALTRNANPAIRTRYELVNLELSRRKVELQAVDLKLSSLIALRSSVNVARDVTFPSQLSALMRERSNADLSDDDWTSFAINFTGDVDSVLNTKIDACRANKASIQGEPVNAATPSPLIRVKVDELPGRTINHLEVERSRLEESVGLDRRRIGQLTEAQRLLSTVTGAKVKAEAAIVRADEVLPLIEEQLNIRTEQYSAFFNALLEEEQQLLSLYEPLRLIQNSPSATLPGR